MGNTGQVRVVNQTSGKDAFMDANGDANRDAKVLQICNIVEGVNINRSVAMTHSVLGAIFWQQIMDTLVGSLTQERMHS